MPDIGWRGWAGWLGASGAAVALYPGSTWIDMSSNSPAARDPDSPLDRGVQAWTRRQARGTPPLLINLLWFGQAVATAEALLDRASGLDLVVLREVLADSPAGSDFIPRDRDALFAGDFMRTFGLDRCCGELQIVTELPLDHHLPFQVSGSVAGLYGRPLRRYGQADGELPAVALLEERAGLR